VDDEMDGFDCLGADVVGFDPTSLLAPAGAIATYGVSAYEADKKEKEQKADQGKALQAVIAADYAASEAAAKADVSAQLKSASAGIDATAAQMASSAQDVAASAGLSAESSKKRADEADKALKAAISEAQKKPKDGYAQAKVRAWQATVNKAHSGAIVARGSGLDSYGGESWFTKPAIGKLPGWGVLVVAAGLLTAGGLLLKKYVFRAA
jgi:hypothetical protein